MLVFEESGLKGGKQMSQRRHSPEQIINKLRQAEVELAKGSTVAQMCKKIGVTEQKVAPLAG